MNTKPLEPPLSETERPRRSARIPRRARTGLAVPAWLVSGVFHATTLLLLAFLTVASSEEPAGGHVLTLAEATADEAELTEFEIEQVEPVELQESVSFVLDVPDPGSIQFGDQSALSEMLAASDAGSLGPPETTVDDIGALFGSEGIGMSEIGTGLGGAMFFGVRTKGRDFVYVVDNSNSMTNGKFETAAAELLRSVQRLEATQRFYVVFFSDTAYPMFHPYPEKALVPATTENKRRLEYWLDSVQRCLKTKGEAAMRLAFSLDPDAIYILGDGSFTDKTVDMMLNLPPLRVTIHTLGFQMKPDAERGLRRIAQKFRGSFTEVKIPPEMVRLAQQVKRARNASANGVWGVTLGSNPKPKGKKKNRK